MTTTTLDAPLFRGDKFEVASIGALLGFVAASQVSVAAAGIMLAITIACWATVVTVHHERVQAPTMFWLLAAYGAATLISALGSPNPAPKSDRLQTARAVSDRSGCLSFRPRPGRAQPSGTVIISVGAIIALVGIAQYGLFHYDNLGKRAHGTLTHYMTYSGVLMLVACARRRAPAVRQRRSPVVGAGDAGGARGAGDHADPQRVGRHVPSASRCCWR